MIDFYKKANFYFIVIPLAAAVWTVLTSTVFLKAANDKWAKMEKEFEKCTPLIAEILVKDPDRMKLHKEKEKMGKFDYSTVIHKFSIAHGIPESGYNLSIAKPRRKKGNSIQGADLTIDNIEIEPFSKYLSRMLYTWPNLQCDSLTLKKENTGPDAWKATMDFKYTFKK